MSTTETEQALAVRMSPSTKRRGARPVDDIETTIEGLIRQLVAVSNRPDRPDAGVNDVIDLPALAAFASLAAAANASLREAVAYVNGNGHSWAEIGKVLGVSRSAAHERFGR